MHRGTRQLHGLDLAEMKLMQGDVAGASTLAHQELDRHTGDTARADFLLARCAVMQRNVDEARHYFEETIRLGKDPRLLAWSHIYLGRMDDLEHSRDDAVAQYQQALLNRDGQLDTKEAAERGLKEPYGPAAWRPPAGGRLRRRHASRQKTLRRRSQPACGRRSAALTAHLPAAPLSQTAATNSSAIRPELTAAL